MFFCWNLTMHLPSQEEFMSHLHMWKSMANKNTKWKLFSIQRYQIVNFDTLFIGVDMIWTNTIENYLNTCWMPWKKWKKIINDIQTSPKPSLLMKLIVTKGGDATIHQHKTWSHDEWSSFMLIFVPDFVVHSWFIHS
jgi:hypothetical protein